MIIKFFKNLKTKINHLCFSFFDKDIFYINFYNFSLLRLFRFLYIPSFLFNYIFKIKMNISINKIIFRLNYIKKIIGDKYFSVIVGLDSLSLSLKEIIKIIFKSLILYCISVSVVFILIYIFGLNIKDFKISPSLQQDILLSISGIIATFIGLYFTALTIVIQSVFSKIKPDIITFLNLDRKGLSYIFLLLVLLGVTFSLSFIISSFSLLSVNYLLFISLISILVICAFWDVAFNTFNYFDPLSLAIKIKDEIIRNLNYLTDIRFKTNEIIQYRLKEEIKSQIGVYEEVCLYLRNIDHVSNQKLEDLADQTAQILSYYLTIKHLIPFESNFYESNKFFDKYYKADIDISLKITLTHKQIQLPEKVYIDREWFEVRIGKIINEICNNIYKESSLKSCSRVISFYFDKLKELLLAGFLDIKTYSKILCSFDLKSFDFGGYSYYNSEIIDHIGSKDLNISLRCLEMYFILNHEKYKPRIPTIEELSDSDYNKYFSLWHYKSLDYYSNKIKNEKLINGSVITSHEYIASEFKELSEMEIKDIFEESLCKVLKFIREELSKGFDVNKIKLYYSMYDFIVKSKYNENLNMYKKILGDESVYLEAIKNLSEFEELFLTKISQFDEAPTSKTLDYQGFSYHILYDKCIKSLANEDYAKIEDHFNKFFDVYKSYKKRIKEDDEIENKNWKLNYLHNLDLDLITLVGCIYSIKFVKSDFDSLNFDFYWKEVDPFDILKIYNIIERKYDNWFMENLSFRRENSLTLLSEKLNKNYQLNNIIYNNKFVKHLLDRHYDEMMFSDGERLYLFVYILEGIFRNKDLLLSNRSHDDKVLILSSINALSSNCSEVSEILNTFYNDEGV